MSVEAYVRNKQTTGSNYDAALQKAACLFADRDMTGIIQKTGCEADEDYLYAELLCRRYRISRRNGKAEQLCSDVFYPAGYDAAMVLYDLLAFSDGNAKVSGKYMQLQNHSKVQNVHSFAGEGAFDRYARLFCGRCRELEHICLDMGGISFGKGDVSYAIPYYRDLRIGISFWDEDDEFSPSLVVFHDENAGAFMHYETMWYASGDLLAELGKRLGRNNCPPFTLPDSKRKGNIEHECQKISEE